MAAVVTHGLWLARRLHRNGLYPPRLTGPWLSQSGPKTSVWPWLLGVLRPWAVLSLISRLPSAAPQAAALLGSVWLRPGWALPDIARALLRTLAGPTDSVSAVAFAPDGRTLASAGWNNTVRLCDPTTGSLAAAGDRNVIGLRVHTGHEERL